MSDKDSEIGRTFIDLIETLSALGNYLNALNHMAQTMQMPERFAEAVEKGIAQHERAANAARQLRSMSVFASVRFPASLLGSE